MSYKYQGCRSLTSVILPDNLTTISEGAFLNCIGLTSITIPNKVTTIKTGAFGGCKGLTTISIPSSVTSIGENAFMDCSGLTSVIIPNSVSTIGKRAFCYCRGLKKITIGSGVNRIGDLAFSTCEELMDVFCSAANVPLTNKYYTYTPFSYSTEKATLHVPASSLEAYKADDSWNCFKNIVALTNDELGIPKCEIPTINYEHGTLQFNCATEGAECVSTITDKDITSYIGNTIELGATYNISVYAFKEGYQNSDVATATLCWIDVEPKTEGIENSEVAEVHANAVLIQSNNGVVTISGVNSGTEIAIYSADGRMQGSKKANDNTTSFSTNLNKGEIAIVKIGDKSVKVVMQ